MSIPFSSLAIPCPEAGDVWGMNLNRTRAPHHEATTDTPHSSWAKMSAHFHRPRHFGKMVFGLPPDISYSMLGLTGNELRFKLRNGKDVSMKVQSEWSGSDRSAGTSPQVALTRLGPGEEKEVRMVYDAHAWGREYPRVPNDLKMSLTISDPESKEISESTEALFRVESPFFSYFSMSMDLYYTPGIREIQLILTPNIERGVRFEVAIPALPGLFQRELWGTGGNL